MCFPSQAWELRSELAGQADPVKLPGSAKTGNRALICGHMELGTRLRNRAVPTLEESDFCPSSARGSMSIPTPAVLQNGLARDESAVQFGEAKLTPKVTQR